MLVLGLIGFLPMMVGCSNTNGDNQVKNSDVSTSAGTSLQANENNAPKNKKVKDPLKIKRADKPKKKPNMIG
jgi:hypothetical protein